MIKFYNYSGIHMLKAEQKVITSLDQAWSFFSAPKNLAKITPPEMDFRITSGPLLNKMHAGQIITYNVSPFKGVRLNWVTEITQVKEKQFFIDEQRFGPYRFWHHQHWFTEEKGTVLMTDIVHYKLPMGIFGRMINPWVVRKKLQRIFEFRARFVDELFNSQNVKP